MVTLIVKIMGRTDFPDQFRKIIIRHKRTGYNLNVTQQSARLGSSLIIFFFIFCFLVNIY